MGKNNNKSNQQQYLKTDIDYDKLAEAIVKAHKKSKPKKKEKPKISEIPNAKNGLKLSAARIIPIMRNGYAESGTNLRIIVPY